MSNFKCREVIVFLQLSAQTDFVDHEDMHSIKGVACLNVGVFLKKRFSDDFFLSG